MNRVALDTNAYSALLSGDHRVADLLTQSDAVLLTPVVIGELYDGFRGGSRYRQNMETFSRFREKPRTLTVAITESTSEWFAEVKQILRRKGKPVPTNDVWIAASCMEHGAHLLSFDTHFDLIEGLLRICIDER